MGKLIRPSVFGVGESDWVFTQFGEYVCPAEARLFGSGSLLENPLQYVPESIQYARLEKKYSEHDIRYLIREIDLYRRENNFLRTFGSSWLKNGKKLDIIAEHIVLCGISGVDLETGTILRMPAPPNGMYKPAPGYEHLFLDFEREVAARRKSELPQAKS
jgi:hypothetical protein